MTLANMLWYPSQKPVRGSLINPAHPLSRGLVGGYLFNELSGSPYNFITRVRPTVYGSPEWYAGIYFHAADKEALGTDIATRNTFTIVTEVATWATTNSMRVWSGKGLNGPDLIQYNTKWNFYGPGFDLYSLENFVLKRYYGLATVYDYGGIGARLYVDGVLHDSDSTISAPTFEPNFFIARRADSDAGYIYADMSYFYVYDRVLSAEEIQLIHQAPYAMWHKDKFVILLQIGADVIEVSCTDGVKIGDTPSIITVFLVSLADGVKSGELSSGSMVLPVSVTDGIESGDSTSSVKTMVASVLEGIITSEEVSVKSVFGVTCTDGLLSGEGGSILMEALLSLSDAAVLSDTVDVSVLGDEVRTCTDGLVVGDSVSVVSIFVASITEGLTLSDFCSKLMAALHTILTIKGNPGQILYRIDGTTVEIQFYMRGKKVTYQVEGHPGAVFSVKSIDNKSYDPIRGELDKDFIIK